MTSAKQGSPGGQGNKAKSPPIYELSVDSGGLSCEIRVNDVPVLRIPNGHVETAFDVNPYVQNGMNMLGLVVRAERGKTAFGPRSVCTVKLGRKSSPKETESEPIASLSFQVPEPFLSGFEKSEGFKAGIPPGIQHSGITATQPFQLDTPFRSWFWTSAPKIEGTEAVRAEVLAMYRRIHGFLKSRDVAALSSACEEQARDWQDAYGFPDLEAAKRSLGIEKTLSDPDVVVEDFPEDVLLMERLGDRRLVQLVDAEGKSPLQLRLKSRDRIVGRFNVVLCRDGAKWVIAR